MLQVAHFCWSSLQRYSFNHVVATSIHVVKICYKFHIFGGLPLSRGTVLTTWLPLPSTWLTCVMSCTFFYGLFSRVTFLTTWLVLPSKWLKCVTTTKNKLHIFVGLVSRGSFLTTWFLPLPSTWLKCVTSCTFLLVFLSPEGHF